MLKKIFARAIADHKSMDAPAGGWVSIWCVGSESVTPFEKNSRIP
jgi:hypothetical protein